MPIKHCEKFEKTEGVNRMQMTFRWYGEKDSIPLSYIRQIPGMSGVVTAVYDVPVGEVWEMDKILRLKSLCDEKGLEMEVIESVPVHEDIKLGLPTRDRYIANYATTIRNLGKAGVKCICYNFMPVFDWTRTQLDKEAKDGSTSLVMYWEQMKGLDPLKDDIHLPGWDSSYTQEEVRELITAYGEIGEEGLWKNLEKFLKEVIPVAEECGVRSLDWAGNPVQFDRASSYVTGTEKLLAFLLATIRKYGADKEL